MTEIYVCDGSCLGNPGPGGWCYASLDEISVKFVYGFEENTTNNRMELFAVLEILRFTKNKKLVYTDSRYVVEGITKWIYSWKKSGWKNSKKEPVKNEDLWRFLDQANSSTEFRWMKGHDMPSLQNNNCKEKDGLQVFDQNLLIKIQNEVDRFARNAAEKRLSGSQSFNLNKF